MSQNGIFHPVNKGGVVSSQSSCPKPDLDEHSTQTPTYGSTGNGCPVSDASPERLDALTKEFLSVAERLGIQYDPDKCDNLADWISSNTSYAPQDTSGPLGSATNYSEALDLANECLDQIKDGSLFDFSIDGNNNITFGVNGNQTTVSVMAPVLAQVTNPDGTSSVTQDGVVIYTSPVLTALTNASGTHELYADGVLVGSWDDADTISAPSPDYDLMKDPVSGEISLLRNGVVIATVDDNDTVSTPAPVLSFAANATNGTDVLLDGVIVSNIPDTDVVITQTGNVYEFNEGGNVVGTITTIPDTNQALALGTQTVNSDGSVVQCFTTVWASHPTIAAGTPVTAVDDVCFTIPAPSQTAVNVVSTDNTVEVTETTDANGDVTYDLSVEGPVTAFLAVGGTEIFNDFTGADAAIAAPTPAAGVPIRENGVLTLANPYANRAMLLVVDFGGRHGSEFSGGIKQLTIDEFITTTQHVYVNGSRVNTGNRLWHLGSDNSDTVQVNNNAFGFFTIPVGGTAVFDRETVFTNRNQAGEDPTFYVINQPSIRALGFPA